MASKWRTRKSDNRHFKTGGNRSRNGGSLYDHEPRNKTYSEHIKFKNQTSAHEAVTFADEQWMKATPKQRVSLLRAMNQARNRARGDVEAIDHKTGKHRYSEAERQRFREADRVLTGWVDAHKGKERGKDPVLQHSQLNKPGTLRTITPAPVHYYQLTDQQRRHLESSPNAVTEYQGNDSKTLYIIGQNGREGAIIEDSPGHFVVELYEGSQEKYRFPGFSSRGAARDEVQAFILDRPNTNRYRAGENPPEHYENLYMQPPGSHARRLVEKAHQELVRQNHREPSGAEILNQIKKDHPDHIVNYRNEIEAETTALTGESGEYGDYKGPRASEKTYEFFDKEDSMGMPVLSIKARSKEEAWAKVPSESNLKSVEQAKKELFLADMVAEPKSERYQIVWKKATANHPEGTPVGYYSGEFFKSADEAYGVLLKHPIGSGDMTVIAVKGSERVGENTGPKADRSELKGLPYVQKHTTPEERRAYKHYRLLVHDAEVAKSAKAREAAIKKAGEYGGKHSKEIQRVDKVISNSMNLNGQITRDRAFTSDSRSNLMAMPIVRGAPTTVEGSRSNAQLRINEILSRSPELNRHSIQFTDATDTGFSLSVESSNIQMGGIARKYTQRWTRSTAPDGKYRWTATEIEIESPKAERPHLPVAIAVKANEGLPLTKREATEVREDIRNRLKTGAPIGYQEAIEFEDTRSPHAREVETGTFAKTIYAQDLPDYSKWARAPNRSDAVGIDIPLNRPLPPKETLPPIEKIPPATEKELAKHPIVLRGDPHVVAKFQPLIDKKYADLKHHPLSVREIDFYERKPKEDGVLGYYESHLVDPKTGRPVGMITLRDIQTGRVIAQPDKVVISPTEDFQTPEDQESATIHEFAHLRRHVQQDATLKKFITDKNREEKEVVLETDVRDGARLLGKTKSSNYYGYAQIKNPSLKYPEVAINDTRILGEYSEEGVTDTKRIEGAIDRNLSKTEIDKPQVAKIGLYPGLRYTGSQLGHKGSIDREFITNQGDFFHVYSPQGTAKLQGEVSLIKRDEGKPKGDKVWEITSSGVKRVG